MAKLLTKLIKTTENRNQVNCQMTLNLQVRCPWRHHRLRRFSRQSPRKSRQSQNHENHQNSKKNQRRKRKSAAREKCNLKTHQSHNKRSKNRILSPFQSQKRILWWQPLQNQLLEMQPEHLIRWLQTP